jgi:DNA-binding SARP family transcriptional activator
MQPLSVRLFGKLTICGHEGEPVDLPACRVKELLSYLMLHRRRPHAREALAALLWPEAPAAQSKKYLRQALWQLQSALRRPSAPSLLRLYPDWVSIDPQASFWLDVDVLERAFALARRATGLELDAAAVAAAEAAVREYRGGLLEGCYHEWCLRERQRLEDLYLALLDRLGAHFEAHGHYEEGTAYDRQALHTDPAREATHRRLMRMLAGSGERAAALRQYERCATALRNELDIEPSPETRILRDQLRAAEPAAVSGAAPQNGTQALRTALDSLRQLGAMLHGLECRVQSQIDAVQAALSGEAAEPAAGPQPLRAPSLRLAARQARRHRANGSGPLSGARS